MNFKKLAFVIQFMVTLVLIVSLSLVFLGVLSYDNNFRYFYRTILGLNLVTLSTNLILNKKEKTNVSKKLILLFFVLTSLLSVAVLVVLFFNK